MTYEKDHPIYSDSPELEDNGGPLIVERFGSRPAYYCFECHSCGFKFTRTGRFGMWCPDCKSLDVGKDKNIRN